jgi:hypothetical protein
MEIAGADLLFEIRPPNVEKFLGVIRKLVT